VVHAPRPLALALTLMPSFKPSRDHLINLTEELISTHHLRGPFLEIGCGDGALSVRLGQLGWSGAATDLSDRAVHVTRAAISAEGLSDRIEVIQGDVRELPLNRLYETVVIYDVLEHVEYDIELVRRIRACLREGGHLLLSVPVKMNEWRWDDDEYGHLRRYEDEQLDQLLNPEATGFSKIVQWDITFPFIWLLRRAYMRVFRPIASNGNRSIEAKTEESAFTNAGGKRKLMLAVESSPVWAPLLATQKLFRSKNHGCNTLILARAV
jgi:SAM-dependent methyltransferase